MSIPVQYRQNPEHLGYISANVVRDKRFTVAVEEVRGCPLLTTDVIRA
jgi:hypothetical protein